MRIIRDIVAEETTAPDKITIRFNDAHLGKHSILVQDIYLFRLHEKESFTAGIVAGKVVRTPVKYKHWLGKGMDAMFEDFQKKEFRINKI